MTTITPEELDAAWAQRHTHDVPTLASIATMHLDMCDLDSIDEDPANFLFLQRASWCVHKMDVIIMMKGFRYPPPTWPPIKERSPMRVEDLTSVRRDSMEFSSVVNAPGKKCNDPLVHTGHAWHEIVEDNKAEMRWCSGR